jgi:hypothetical protein
MNPLPHNVSLKFKREPSPLFCQICGKPVAVETSKTDEDGRAIHEDCYVMKVRLKQASKDGQEYSC